MPRTHGRIKVEVWDVGSDWRNLTVDAQWTYEMLISQPGVTMCGVLLYAPKKWAKLAAGLTIDRIDKAIAELEKAWYVIVDTDADELLIRTFIKHDAYWRNPNLVKAGRRQYREIESGEIRSYLSKRHPWLTNGDISIDAITALEEEASKEAAEPVLRPSKKRAS